MKITVEKIERNGRTPDLPVKATKGAAAFDLHAFLEAPVTLAPGARFIVPTGLRLAIPEGMAGLVLARSGLASKKGISLSNGVGLIDSDYRGELMVAVHNGGTENFVIEDGMRIAQFMAINVPDTFFEEGAVDETERGEGGFGSTGTRGEEVK